MKKCSIAIAAIGIFLLCSLSIWGNSPLAHTIKKDKTIEQVDKMARQQMKKAFYMNPWRESAFIKDLKIRSEELGENVSAPYHYQKMGVTGPGSGAA